MRDGFNIVSTRAGVATLRSCAKTYCCTYYMFFNVMCYINLGFTYLLTDTTSTTKSKTETTATTTTTTTATATATATATTTTACNR